MKTPAFGDGGKWERKMSNVQTLLARDRRTKVRLSSVQQKLTGGLLYEGIILG